MLHYGPTAEASGIPSGQSTPAHELQRRLSDPPMNSWESSKPYWSTLGTGDEGYIGTEQLPQMAYGDERGPPYSEDEDLHSPVVVSARHKKSKSAHPNLASGHTQDHQRVAKDKNRSDDKESEGLDRERGYFTGMNGDGSTTYYISEADETANGPGGELVTYPPDQIRHPMLFPHTYHSPHQNDSRIANTPSDRASSDLESPYQDDSSLEPGSFNDDSRYSRDYQFTIASPDEEMHGKAVALFDFARENENELPLIEGQVILVSYRHGQGWLVAQDPKTGESGLVPEEYVRLLRDIEGGWISLNGEGSVGDSQGLLSPDTAGPDSTATLTLTSVDSGYGHSTQNSNGSNVTTAEKRPPIVSTFSTSSKDLNPYPHHLLGTQAGQQPPQVVHYGSQTPTPVMSPSGGTSSRQGSFEDNPLRRENSREEGR